MTTLNCTACGADFGGHYWGCPHHFRNSVKDNNPEAKPRPTKPFAVAMLAKAAEHMEERGKIYDTPGGERSMGKTVAAFNAITGEEITEAQGWLLLQLLKDVRLFARPGYHADSAEDAIAYAALKAEAKQKETD